MESITLATLDMDAVLCLVKGEYGAKQCYFTTAPIREQWGDDWNDSPHWCNAGEPYVHDGQKLYVVVVEGASFPEEDCSAEDCNTRRVPWLVDGHNWDDRGEKRVYGGITLRDFVTKCHEYDWMVYLPVAAPREAT